MGVYLNPGKKGFFEAKNDKIYVDKSNIIRYTNEVLYTDNKHSFLLSMNGIVSLEKKRWISMHRKFIWII